MHLCALNKETYFRNILFSATSCLDLDECQVNENVCRNGKCENVVGSFNCICDDGYSIKEKLEGDASKSDKSQFILVNFELLTHGQSSYWTAKSSFFF